MPVSLSPLNDTLEITLPSPLLVFQLIGPNLEECEFYRESAPQEGQVLRVALHKAPSAFSLQESLLLSLLAIVVIACCYEIVSRKVEQEQRVRNRQQKRLWESHSGKGKMPSASPQTQIPRDTNQSQANEQVSINSANPTYDQRYSAFHSPTTPLSSLSIMAIFTAQLVLLLLHRPSKE